MQRENVFKIFIKGFGFGFFGNILGGIMTISLAPFISEWFISYIALLFSLFIYLSLLFTAGLKDGQRERVMLRNKRVEKCPKYRWLILGAIIGAIMCIPAIILLLGIAGVIGLSGEYLFAFRFLSGAVYPLMHVAEAHNVAVTEIPLWYPIASMTIYFILSPIAAQLGYKFGYDEKKLQDYMYEKQ